MKKKSKPGDLFKKFQDKKKRKHGLRSPEAVVKSEQNASHQFYKGKKKRKTPPGGTSSSRPSSLEKTAVKVYRGINKVGAKIGKIVADRKQAQKNFENRSDNSNYYGTAKSWLKNKKK